MSEDQTAINNQYVKKKTNKLSETIKWIITLLILAAAVSLFACKILFPPRFVETGSMRPEYEIGAIAWVNEKAYTDSKPQEGDVAVYETGGREVMHRIIQVNNDGTYTFKGDNNQSEDFSPVPLSKIKGKVIFHTNLFAPIVRKLHHLSNT